MKLPQQRKADFSAKGRLTRYLEKEECKPNSRVSPKAFRKKSATDKLSVSSLSVATQNQIASDYANKFQNGTRPVGLCVCTVPKFVDSAESQSLKMRYDAAQGNWDFGSSAVQWAFEYAPKDWSKAHCECAFTAIFTDQQDFNFAGRMALGATWKSV